METSYAGTNVLKHSLDLAGLHPALSSTRPHVRSQQRQPSLLTVHRTQGFYRRGDAHFALGKYKAALKDFKSAARLALRDPDLRKKLAACEKEVKRIRFEEALATPVSVVNTVCVATLGAVLHRLLLAAFSSVPRSIASEASDHNIVMLKGTTLPCRMSLRYHQPRLLTWLA